MAIIRRYKMDATIARTIYEQIGGNRFAVMTGAKDIVLLPNGLRFRIGRNKSKTNLIEIKLNGMDLYDMEFIYHRNGYLKVDHKKLTAKWIDDKTELIKRFENIYFDQLEELFTMVTGLYTRL